MQTLLFLHNLIRWCILIAGIYAITKAALGYFKKRAFTAADNKSQLFFVLFCHTQLLIGLILYFISPAVDEAFRSGKMMTDAAYRFVAVEHIATMIIAIAFIQAGRIVSKKATEDAAKHRKALIFFSIGMLLILSRIPWHKPLIPGM
ncbi:MAG: hypothetical protein ACHQK8_02910 [Bacteroidia bacterium]